MASRIYRAIVLAAMLIAIGLLCAAPAPPGVFEIEIPDLGIPSTAEPELTISSPKISQIRIHILNPQAQEIDYGQIFARMNGEAAGRIQEVTAGERGKTVRLYLEKWPGFQLVSGRNTIEIEAKNQRGRVFYASFVLHSTRQNPHFIYETQPGSVAGQRIPPEIFLFEPETAIEVSPRQKSRFVRIAGLATAADAIDKITVNGTPVVFLGAAKITLRRVGLLHEDNRVYFDTTRNVVAGMNQISVEAVDRSGNRTQVLIPVGQAAGNPVEEFHGRKFALVIGISRFQNNEAGINDLKFAAADAGSVYQFLQTKSAGSFPLGNIRFLSNEQATLKNVREALSTFLAKIEPEDLLLIFFASHGTPDPLSPQDLYFVVHDTALERMADTAMGMKEFKQLLDQNLRADRLFVLIDTCHSAGMTARGISNNLVNLYAQKMLYREEGTAVITSSDVNEASLESDRWGGGHGVFTYFVLQGLNGKADDNADGLVTAGELFRYVRSNVRFATEFRQNPRMMPGENENLALSVVLR